MTIEGRASTSLKPSIVGLMALSIAMIAALAYGPMLEYFFTATDTLTLIETSRIQSIDDVTRLLSEPLMAGTRFAQGVLY